MGGQTGLVPKLLLPCSLDERMLNLKTLHLCAALLAAGILVGCSQTSTKSPDVTAGIRTSLDQAGLKDVSVSQDREKGVVPLNGHVASDGDKAQAQSIATSMRSEEHTSELQSLRHLVCRLLL